MHYREIRDGRFKFICSDCGEAFDFRYQVEAHQDQVFRRCQGRAI